MHSLILIPVVALMVIAWQMHRRWLRQVALRRRLQQRAEANGECIRRSMLAEHGAPSELTQPVPPEVLRLWGWAYSDEGVVYAPPASRAA